MRYYVKKKRTFFALANERTSARLNNPIIRSRVRKTETLLFAIIFLHFWNFQEITSYPYSAVSQRLPHAFLSKTQPWSKFGQEMLFWKILLQILRILIGIVVLRNFHFFFFFFNLQNISILSGPFQFWLIDVFLH